MITSSNATANRPAAACTSSPPPPSVPIGQIAGEPGRNDRGEQDACAERDGVSLALVRAQEARAHRAEHQDRLEPLAEHEDGAVHDHSAMA